MSLKNKWRKAGRLEIRRETSRLSDGTPWGDVLWIRTAKVNGQRKVAYCYDRKEGKGAECGSFQWLPPISFDESGRSTETPRNAVTIAKAIRRYCIAVQP